MTRYSHTQEYGSIASFLYLPRVRTYPVNLTAVWFRRYASTAVSITKDTATFIKRPKKSYRELLSYAIIVIHMEQTYQTETSLKKRKIISIITLLTGVPGLFSFLLFLYPGVSFSPIVFYIVLAFVVRGVAGTVGAIGLWEGKKWGYWAAIVMWLYLVLASIFNMYLVFFSEAMQIQFFLNDTLKMTIIGKSLGKFLFGIPILVILGMDLWRTKKIEWKIKLPTKTIAFFAIFLVLIGGIAMGTWNILSQPVARNIEPVSEQYIQEMEERSKDWKVYQNRKYDMTFKYPPIFELRSNEDEDSDLFEMFSLETIADLFVPDIGEGYEVNLSNIGVILDSDPAQQAATVMAEIIGSEVEIMQIGDHVFYKIDSSDEESGVSYAEFYMDFSSRKYKSLSFTMYFDKTMLDIGLSHEEIAETILYSLTTSP